MTLPGALPVIDYWFDKHSLLLSLVFCNGEPSQVQLPLAMARCMAPASPSGKVEATLRMIADRTFLYRGDVILLLSTRVRGRPIVLPLGSTTASVAMMMLVDGYEEQRVGNLLLHVDAIGRHPHLNPSLYEAYQAAICWIASVNLSLLPSGMIVGYTPQQDRPDRRQRFNDVFTYEDACHVGKGTNPYPVAFRFGSITKMGRQDFPFLVLHQPAAWRREPQQRPLPLNAASLI